jgi:HdeA/HdeB family protein
MKLKSTALLLAISLLPLTAHAQITVQMADIRCDQYLAMPPAQQEKFSAWMSGWFSYQTRTPWVDFLQYRQNIANVKAWCLTYPNEKIMTGLKKATRTQ